MKGRKKKEYRMEVNIYDTITTSVIISETTYKKKLRELQEQVAKNQNETNEFRPEEKTQVIDRPEFTKTIYHVNLNMADIDLVAIICKPGYCFK